MYTRLSIFDNTSLKFAHKSILLRNTLSSPVGQWLRCVSRPFKGMLSPTLLSKTHVPFHFRHTCRYSFFVRINGFLRKQNSWRQNSAYGSLDIGTKDQLSIYVELLHCDYLVGTLAGFLSVDTQDN